MHTLEESDAVWPSLSEISLSSMSAETARIFTHSGAHNSSLAVAIDISNVFAERKASADALFPEREATVSALPWIIQR